jgi:hypothetical protein
MTEQSRPVPGEDTHETDDQPATPEIERGADAPLEPDRGSEQPEEPNPWLKEGADAPDAADIEDPDEQR